MGGTGRPADSSLSVATAGGREEGIFRGTPGCSYYTATGQHYFFCQIVGSEQNYRGRVATDHYIVIHFRNSPMNARLWFVRSVAAVTRLGLGRPSLFCHPPHGT